MKHIFDIAMKDIRQTLRDKMTFLFLLVMPILFTFMFGFAFGGFSTGDVDRRLAVGFQDLDRSQVSQGLKTLLESQTEIRVEETTASSEEPQQLVDMEKMAAVVTVPEGYGKALQSGVPLKLQVILDPANANGLTAQNAIQTAAVRTASAVAAASSVVAEDNGQITANNSNVIFEQRFETAISAWMNPPVRLKVIGSGVDGQAAEENSGTVLPISHTAPAMMIQFSLAGLLTAAQVLVHERKTRCMQRLLTTRVARSEILLGHFLAIFIVILVQFVLLVVFGQMILHLDYLRLPAATLLMMICTALFVASVGLLVGSLARTDEQAVIFAMAPMFILSGLGGAWMPLEATGETFRSIGKVTPVAIALDGFQNIIARGLDFNAVLIPAAVMLGYALVCFSLAVWKFKFE